MKIMATADLHGNLPEIEPCDILLIAGDILPDFGFPSSKGKQDHWARSQLHEWLHEIPVKQIVAIAGNHDFAFQNHPWLTRELPWHYLQDELIEIEGVFIYGTPWVPKLASWAFYKPAEELIAAYAQIPPDIDILLSHGPPYGVGDAIRGISYINAHFVPEKEHAGSQELLDAVKEKRPAKTVFGHIHEGFGFYPLNGMEFYNVAFVDEAYVPRNQIIEIL